MQATSTCSTKHIAVPPFYFVAFAHASMEKPQMDEATLLLVDSASAICVQDVGLVSQDKALSRRLALPQFRARLYTLSFDGSTSTDLLRRVLAGIGYVDTATVQQTLHADHIHVLTLPEFPLRTQAFISHAPAYLTDGRPYTMINGLKHEIPVVGVGMSYQMIIHNAKRQNLPYVVVCEDDVHLAADFGHKYDAIMRYLVSNLDAWDIFVGVMENIDASAQLDNVVRLALCDGGELVLLYMNTFTSMVFNVYNASMYDSVLSWNASVRTLGNTIDAYLSKQKLRIVTALPFIASHNGELTSTIWKNRSNQLSLRNISSTLSKMTGLLSNMMQATDGAKSVAEHCTAARSVASVVIYILVPDEALLAEVKDMYSSYRWARPVFMRYQDATFENAFWKQLLEMHEEWKDCEMVGTMSWRACKKIDMESVDRYIDGRIYKLENKRYHHFYDTDVPVLKHRSIRTHPHFATIWKDVLAELKLSDTTSSHCNYFMTAPELMLKFLHWHIDVCAPVVMKHPLIMTDAHYPLKNLSTEHLQKLCGVPHYPHAPFIMERLNKCFFVTYA